MIHTKYKGVLIAGIVGIVLAFSSCKDRFEELNTNPNEPTEVPTSFILTSAQHGIMDATWDEWFNGRRGNQLAQYWASNQYSNESRYQLRTAITNTYWSIFYAGSVTIAGSPSFDGGGLKDLQQIIDLNTEDPEANAAYGDPDNQIAVATILKVWLLQNMTDCWGAIPYTEALQGDAEEAVIYPSYDLQEAVYTQLLSDLEDANNRIDASAAGPEGDQIYGGDMNLWKKFCNSLRMRVALRMADVNGSVAQNHFLDAMNDGPFTSNADNALYPYTSTPDNNPINEAFKTRTDFAASNIMVDKLLDLDDPRIEYFYEPAVSSGNYVGEIYGLSEANAAVTPDDDVSQLSAEVLAPDFPGVYLDYAQVEFMLAEAAERGWIGDAATHYENGVRASLEFWNRDGGISSQDMDDYYNQASVNYADRMAATSGDWRVVIGEQKWIALYMQGIQGWTEWRRLDFGILQLPADGVLAGTGIPVRMLYPIDEQTRNLSNYQDAVSDQGPDNMDTKLWWDVN